MSDTEREAKKEMVYAASGLIFVVLGFVSVILLLGILIGDIPLTAASKLRHEETIKAREEATTQSRLKAAANLANSIEYFKDHAGYCHEIVITYASSNNVYTPYGIVACDNPVVVEGLKKGISRN
ncbi:hypothetical protein H0W91_01480 [Patescibacteria group bacterium]|nr:hypothetical protein [Patescibacteria group bacterium]